MTVCNIQLLCARRGAQSHSHKTRTHIEVTQLRKLLSLRRCLVDLAETNKAKTSGLGLERPLPSSTLHLSHPSISAQVHRAQDIGHVPTQTPLRYESDAGNAQRRTVAAVGKAQLGVTLCAACVDMNTRLKKQQLASFDSYRQMLICHFARDSSPALHRGSSIEGPLHTCAELLSSVTRRSNLHA